MRRVGVAVLFFLSGCGILPSEFQPVSKERCEKLDMHELGRIDAFEGFRRGTKYDWWVSDCRVFSVQLDRQVYDTGYDLGLKDACACEVGFEAGVRGEFLELRRQYYECNDQQKKRLKWSYAEGEKLKDDETLMKKTTTLKVEYFNDKISARAKEACTQAQ